MKLYMFQQFPCPSSGVFHCTHSTGMCHTCLLTASCPTDDGQGNCLKHVEFHSKNKFEKLVHLIGFILRNLSCCTVTWMSNSFRGSSFEFHWAFFHVCSTCKVKK